MLLYRIEFAAMASANELQLWGADEATVQAAAAAAIADIRRIEAKYSRYRPDSVTSAINAAAGARPVAIDAETAALLNYADRCHRVSDGRFDITSGVFRRAWDFRRQPPRVPGSDELARLSVLVDWPAVEWDDHFVRLPCAGMEIDFGGIGKEYAADRAATCCAAMGVRHGLVNLGGDVRVIGPQPGDLPWQIGIAHPRRQGVIAVVALRQGALATSGDYQRYFEIGHTRYCHLLDPRTGTPASTWQSASVVAPLCSAAGSLATIAMIAGQEALALLDGEGVDYLLVDMNGACRGPLGAAPRPTPARVTARTG